MIRIRQKSRFRFTGQPSETASGERGAGEKENHDAPGNGKAEMIGDDFFEHFRFITAEKSAADDQSAPRFRKRFRPQIAGVDFDAGLIIHSGMFRRIGKRWRILVEHEIFSDGKTVENRTHDETVRTARLGRDNGMTVREKIADRAESRPRDLCLGSGHSVRSGSE